MIEFIKTSLVFIGGMVAGGYCVVNAALKSEPFTDALKDAITKKTIETILGPENNRPKRKVSYASYYDAGASHHCANRSDEIVFETLDDAYDALGKMNDSVQDYGIVTLADLYDLARLIPPYTANKYGWISVEGSKVVRCREGYFIKLPEPMKIK